MKKAIFFISIVTSFIASCGTGSSIQYMYQAPENLDDGLEVGTLEEANLDSAMLGEAVDRIRAGEYNIVHSMLIYRNGKLVFEEYFPGYMHTWGHPSQQGRRVDWDEDSRHTVMSAGKSITSACIGIAIEEGFIESVDQSIFDYLPDHQYLNTDGKDAITIEHLLTMTSGLEWDEWNTSYISPANDAFLLFTQCDDQVACVLKKPLVNEPGTDFTYTGGGMTLLSEIIRNATGMDIEAFADEYLFAPLGIEPVEWRRFASGVIEGGGEQRMSSRDMVKFGVTFLNGGVWDGQRIVSEQWVQNSATTYPATTRIRLPGSDSGTRGYAYTWWTKEYSQSDAFFATGYGGQVIMVLPELNAVVVFTGGNYTTSVRTFTLLERYFLPAFN